MEDGGSGWRDAGRSSTSRTSSSIGQPWPQDRQRESAGQREADLGRRGKGVGCGRAGPVARVSPGSLFAQVYFFTSSCED